MGTPRVQSDQSLAWTAMVAPPADLRHGFGAGRLLEADPPVRVVVIRPNGRFQNCLCLPEYSGAELNRIEPAVQLAAVLNRFVCYGLLLLGDKPGHVCVYSFRLKTFVDPLTVGSRSVLAYLPLPLDSQDRYFNSDNCPDLALNE
jgi:hypothetical protein